MFCSLSSFSVFPFALSSLKLHRRNFSPISHGLSLISHRTTSLSLHQWWVLDFWGWRLDQRGSTSWVWIIGLGSVDGGFGSVDQWVWNDGSVDRWVDRLGWSLVAPMVTSVMIFGYFRRPRFQIGGMDLLIGGLSLLIGGLGGGCGGRCWLQLVWWFVCVCVALLMVCVCVCVALLWLGCGWSGWFF